MEWEGGTLTLYQNARDPIRPQRFQSTFPLSAHSQKKSLVDSVSEKFGEGQIPRGLEPVLVRVLAAVGLDHVEGVGVARRGRGVPLALVVHLAVDQHDGSCNGVEGLNEAGKSSRFLRFLSPRRLFLHGAFEVVLG